MYNLEKVMAMRLANQPSVTGPIIRSISGSLVGIQSPEELSLLSEAVSNVVMNGVPTTQTTKYGKGKQPAKKKSKPGATKQVSKPLRKKKKAKAQHNSKPGKSVKPKPKETNGVCYEDDSDRYAMWWSFNTNLTEGEYPNYRGVKVVPYPPDPKDKVKAQRDSRTSQECRKSLEIVRALGITPRAERKREGLIGSSPHPAKPEFGLVVAMNRAYEMELVQRYCVQADIRKHIPWADNIVSMRDQLEITRGPVSQTGAEDHLNVEDTIQRLEQHIAESSAKHTDKVESVTVDQARYDNALLKAQSEVFDMSITEVAPSAANDPLPPWDDSETAMETDQCVPLADLTIEQRESDPELNRYYHSMRFNHENPDYQLDFIDIYTMDNYDDSEGRAYMEWLRNRDSSSQRKRCEDLRAATIPGYLPNYGEEVHPLYQCNRPSFDRMVGHMNHRRIAAYDFKLLDCRGFGSWYRGTEFLFNKQSKPETIVDQWLGFDEAKKEQVAQKLLDNSNERLERELNQLTFKEWNRTKAKYFERIWSQNRDYYDRTGYFVAVWRRVVIPPLASQDDTNDSKVVPTPDQGAEVVSFADEKRKRVESKVVAELVGNLSSTLKRSLAALTPDQRAHVREYLKRLDEA